MNKFVEKLDRVFTKSVEAFTFVGFIAMILLVFVNVLGRFIFRMGITESEEIARILFVWITYMGAILCFKTNSHVLVDILINFLHGTSRKIVDTISNLMVTGILALTFYHSLNLIKVNMGTLTPLTKIPLALVEAIVPISMLIMLIINLYKMVQIILKKYD